MKVLILGGTGAMGVHLVHNLVSNGIETCVTTRSKQISEKNITYLQGNAKDLTFLESVLSEHWDAIVDFMVYSTNEFQTRVKLLLNATSQYIFLSSARVFANSVQPLTENSARLLEVSDDNIFLSTDEYSLSKARQEEILKTHGKKNWTIIRPYITYSEKRFQLGVLEKEEWLYRALKGRTIVFSKDIAQASTTITYGADVSKGIFAIIGKQQSLGNTFNITNTESHTWEKILAIYIAILKENLGYKPKVILVDMRRFFPVHPAKYQIHIDRLFDRKFDNTKISEFLGEYKFTKTEEGLKRCLTEFIEHPEFNVINWRREGLKDKIAKEKTALKEITGLKQKLIYCGFRYLPINIMNIITKTIS